MLDVHQRAGKALLAIFFNYLDWVATIQWWLSLDTGMHTPSNLRRLFWLGCR